MGGIFPRRVPDRCDGHPALIPPPSRRGGRYTVDNKPIQYLSRKQPHTLETVPATAKGKKEKKTIQMMRLFKTCAATPPVRGASKLTALQPTCVRASGTRRMVAAPVVLVSAREEGISPLLAWWPPSFALLLVIIISAAILLLLHLSFVTAAAAVPTPYSFFSSSAAAQRRRSLSSDSSSLSHLLRPRFARAQVQTYVSDNGAITFSSNGTVMDVAQVTAQPAFLLGAYQCYVPQLMQDPTCRVGSEAVLFSAPHRLFAFHGSNFAYLWHPSYIATPARLPILWPWNNIRSGRTKADIMSAMAAGGTSVVPLFLTPTFGAPVATPFRLYVECNPNVTMTVQIALGYTYDIGVSSDVNCTAFVVALQAITHNGTHGWIDVPSTAQGIYTVCWRTRANGTFVTPTFAISTPTGHSHAQLHVGIAEPPRRSFTLDPQLPATTLLYGNPLTFSMSLQALAAPFTHVRFDTSMDLCTTPIDNAGVLISSFATNGSHILDTVTLFDIRNGGAHVVICAGLTASGPWTLVSTNAVLVEKCVSTQRAKLNPLACIACLACSNGGTCPPQNVDRAVYFPMSCACPSGFYGPACQFARLPYPTFSVNKNGTVRGRRVALSVSPNIAAAGGTVLVSFPNGTANKNCLGACYVTLLAGQSMNWRFTQFHSNGSASFSINWTLTAQYSLSASQSGSEKKSETTMSVSPSLSITQPRRGGSSAPLNPAAATNANETSQIQKSLTVVDVPNYGENSSLPEFSRGHSCMAMACPSSSAEKDPSSLPLVTYISCEERVLSVAAATGRSIVCNVTALRPPQHQPSSMPRRQNKSGSPSVTASPLSSPQEQDASNNSSRDDDDIETATSATDLVVTQFPSRVVCTSLPVLVKHIWRVQPLEAGVFLPVVVLGYRHFNGAYHVGSSFVKCRPCRVDTGEPGGGAVGVGGLSPAEGGGDGEQGGWISLVNGGARLQPDYLPRWVYAGACLEFYTGARHLASTTSTVIIPVTPANANRAARLSDLDASSKLLPLSNAVPPAPINRRLYKFIATTVVTMLMLACRGYSRYFLNSR